VILQLLFQNPVAGYPKVQFMKTEIGLAERSAIFKMVKAKQTWQRERWFYG